MSDIPEGFLTQAEVDNADKRIADGEFADRDEALATIVTERGAKWYLAEQERAAASFPPAGATPSIGEHASLGDPPVDAEPEAKPEPVLVEEVDVFDVPPEPEPEVVEEPEPEPKRGRR